MAIEKTIDVSVAKRFKRVFDALQKDGKVKNRSQFADKLKTVPPNITGIFENAKPTPKEAPKPVGKGKAKAKKGIVARYPTVRMIFYLSKAYSVNANWLITGKGDMFIN